MALKLVTLEKKYQRQLTEMLDEWSTYNKENPKADRSPRVLWMNDYHDFDKYVKDMYDGNLAISMGYVPATTFFLYDDERDIFIGAAHVRHYLNDAIKIFGGHIGDGIRPSERKKGYATKMIGLVLLECKKLGINRVLMTCDWDNIGSAKSIMNNGGVLENELFNEEDGVLEKRFWIDIK